MADQARFIVPADLDGARVDKAVATLLGVSRAVARSLVDAGVELDAMAVGPGDRVRTGAVLVTSRPDALPALAAEPVPFGILYQDDHLIVVDKPAGVVAHPGTGRRSGTLASGLLDRFPELEGVGEPGRWGLVHRLDKDTSGVLVVGRSQAAHTALVDALRRRGMKRTYLALVSGPMGSATGTIDAPIGRDPARPMLQTVRHDGRPARTHYRVVEVFPSAECTLLEVDLESGRTHQIRVHLASIGHPVVGDPTYGRGAARVGAPRIFLHAWRIELEHPVTGAKVEVESPLPADLQGVLDTLRSSG